MSAPVRRTVLVVLLLGLTVLQAATNRDRASACEITGPTANLTSPMP